MECYLTYNLLNLQPTTLKFITPKKFCKDCCFLGIYNRSRAIECLGLIEGDGSIGVLLEAFKDWKVEKKAVLKGYGMKGLILVLRDKDKDVRRKVAEALGKIGGKEATKPLIKALGDENWDVRKQAAEALGQIGDKEAV